MRFRPVLLAAAVALLGACGNRPPALPQPNPTSIVGDDGTRLVATFYPVEAPHPPGLVLIHAINGHRDDWHRFARAAQRAGFASLAFDLRGHGDTLEDTHGRALSPRELTTDDWRLITTDIDAARRALQALGVNPGEIGIAGASAGANLALQFAARNDAIQALLLVSPGLTREGIAAEAAMQAYRERPALIMQGAHDAYAASSGRALAAIAPGFCELREYSTGAHGTTLFDASDQALEQALYWLGTVLRGAHLPESAPLSHMIP